MIVKEVVIIKGAQYNHTYSDSGKMIERSGIKYSDAIDPLDSNFEYSEAEETSPVTLTLSMLSSPSWTEDSREVYEVRVDGSGNVITQILYS